MAHLARPSDLLTEEGRTYARKLMSSVDPSQDWGVSAGPGKGVSVELKNGWLPRGRHGWAVHSVGHVSGQGRDYLIAVLTLSPLALGVSRGAGLQQPLATAIIFGLTAAVPLVLLFLPAAILALRTGPTGALRRR